MRKSAAPYGANIGDLKPAGGEVRRVKKKLAWRLEPEGKSEANNAATQSIADHVIAHAGISETNERSLLARKKPGILYVGIDALEVGMIKHVLESRVEFQAGALIHLDVLEQRNISDVGWRVLREVAPRTKRCAKNALRSGGVDNVSNRIRLHRCSIGSTLNGLVERNQLGRRQRAGAAEVAARVARKDTH